MCNVTFDLVGELRVLYVLDEFVHIDLVDTFRSEEDVGVDYPLFVLGYT